MNTAMTGAQVEKLLHDLCEFIQQRDPTKAVCLSVATGRWHNAHLTTSWSVSVGHGGNIQAGTLLDLMAKLEYTGSPQDKRDRAERLRAEAEQLEAAAKIQSPTA